MLCDFHALKSSNFFAIAIKTKKNLSETGCISASAYALHINLQRKAVVS